MSCYGQGWPHIAFPYMDSLDSLNGLLSALLSLLASADGLRLLLLLL